MICAEQIPDDVVEPVARALCIAEGCDPERLRLKSSDKLWTAWADEARAAIAAALNAWPDRHLHEWQRPWLGGMSGTDIILPLPQEPRDE